MCIGGRCSGSGLSAPYRAVLAFQPLCSICCLFACAYTFCSPVLRSARSVLTFRLSCCLFLLSFGLFRKCTIFKIQCIQELSTPTEKCPPGSSSLPEKNSSSNKQQGSQERGRSFVLCRLAKPLARCSA